MPKFMVLLLCELLTTEEHKVNPKTVVNPQHLNNSKDLSSMVIILNIF